MSQQVILEVLTGKEKGRQITVPTTGALLGREPDCDICLDETTLSRKHCRFAFENGLWVVKDLDSRSGVFINGHKTGNALKQGDEIKLGLLCLKVVSVPSSTAPLSRDSHETQGIRRGGNKQTLAITAVALVIIGAIVFAVFHYQDVNKRPHVESVASESANTASASAVSSSPVKPALQTLRKSVAQSRRKPDTTKVAATQPKPELEGRDLQAWKIAYRSALSVFDRKYPRDSNPPAGFTATFGPTQPQKRLMEKTATGDYFFYFYMTPPRQMIRVAVDDLTNSLKVGRAGVENCSGQDFEKRFGSLSE